MIVNYLQGFQKEKIVENPLHWTTCQESKRRILQWQTSEDWSLWEATFVGMLGSFQPLYLSQIFSMLSSKHSETLRRARSTFLAAFSTLMSHTLGKQNENLVQLFYLSRPSQAIDLSGDTCYICHNIFSTFPIGVPIWLIPNFADIYVLLCRLVCTL